MHLARAFGCCGSDPAARGSHDAPGASLLAQVAELTDDVPHTADPPQFFFDETDQTDQSFDGVATICALAGSLERLLSPDR